MEAHLSAVHGIRYSDRWRFDDAGQRRLTLREIWVRLQYPPNDSPIVIALNKDQPRWGHVEYLLSDIWKAWTGKDHPARPIPRVQPKQSAARDRRIRQLKKQFAERNRAIEAGEI
ncbi:hypothetical protein AB0362_13085 [Rhodococcus sp. NPDC079359]|uniref:hypothetical protein n=1 Tax=Rhodococcus sp. NPDC079359 TaxID=3154961 RepID=UPI00344C4F44